jgi:hypothetical protein
MKAGDGFKGGLAMFWGLIVSCSGWGNPLGNLHGGAAAWLVDT